MNSAKNDLLLLAGKTLTVLIQAIMGFATVVIALTVIGVTLFQGTIDQEIIAEFGPQAVALPVASILWLLATVLVLCALIYLFFGKLRGIIDTVADGDPFAPENADRLSAMGWLQIGIYLLGIAASAAAALAAEWAGQFTDVEINGALAAEWAGQFTDVEINGSLEIDIPSVLLILVLFILARVFRHGAAMRADLEGTV